jgi:hypothetical protein
MEYFSRDVLYCIGIKMNIQTLINFCSCNKKINEKLYKSNPLWRFKIQEDYPHQYKALQKFLPEMPLQNMYILTYRTTKIKWERNIYDFQIIDGRPVYSK